METEKKLPRLTRSDGKLKAPFKRRWVAALRSGKFIQGHDSLAGPAWDENLNAIDTRYCCLGVAAKLCDVLVMVYGYGQVGDGVDKDCFLPPEMGLTEEIQGKLAGLNDGVNAPPKSFRWIAAYIERYL